MARTRTLAELRTQVRQLADIENAVAYTDAEVNQLINDAIATLHQLLVQSWEDDYTEQQIIPTVDGQYDYALSGAGAVGVFKVRSVEVLDGQVYRPLSRWSFDNRYVYDTARGRPAAYRLIGRESITLMPEPDGVYSLRVWLVPPPVELVADGDTYDGVSGYERFVVLDAAIRIGIKEESDVRAMVSERAQMKEDIARSASTKDAGRPDTYADTEMPESSRLATNSLWYGR